MGFIGKFSTLRSNKKYNYSPRYYEEREVGGNPYKFQRKLDKFKTPPPTRGLNGKLGDALADMRRLDGRSANRRFLIIFIILLMLFLYILVQIDFNFSFFIKR